MYTQFFTTEGIHCSACQGRVTKLLSPLDGISDVQVNVLRKTMTVTLDTSRIRIEDIISIMAKNGYTITPSADTSTKQDSSSAGLQELQFGMPQKPQAVADIDSTITSAQKPSSAANPVSGMPPSLQLSLFFALILMYVAMAPMLSLPLPQMLTGTENAFLWALLQGLLCLPILWAHRHLFIAGFRSALAASPSMDTLVGLGSAAATFFGVYALIRMFFAQNDAHILEHFAHNLYFDSAGMILALIGLGKHFELRARGQASSAIDALLRLRPSTTIALIQGKEVHIATKDVRKGHILVVHSGQSIAADGILTHGSAFIDESAITGESLPVEKQVGDQVIGATVSQSGYFQMEVTGIGEETTLGRIIALVDAATASKAPIARLADRISAVFVPIIIAIALCSFIVWLMLGQSLEFAMSIAISVLVISCPCALGLATPTAIMVGTGLGAEKGILFKTAAAIERMQAVNTIALDKTGTITHGKPQVTDIISLDDNEKSHTELLQLTASLEKLSEHPLGKAIVAKAEEDNINLIPRESLQNFIQKPGLGIEAMHKNTRILAGNERMLLSEGLENPMHSISNELAAQGKTVLFLLRIESAQKQILGLIAVADTIKESSKQAIQQLHNLGLSVTMLTGDNAITSKYVQNAVGIDTAFAGMLPEDKEAKVRTIQEQGNFVAMVGDGINDAPALSRAHVGIAIGAGTDIAMQSADIVLMQSDVRQVAYAYALSKATMRTIKQNLFWAFAYNTLLIPLAAGLFYLPLQWTLNPMIAAASMSLSSLTVVSNALRLRGQKERIFSA